MQNNLHISNYYDTSSTQHMSIGGIVGEEEVTT
jgi:hypothetical protein